MAVDARDARALTRHTGGPNDFEARLRGRRIIGAARRGKFLWLPLDQVPGPLVTKDNVDDPTLWANQQ